ncbi:MAG: YdcH family protein [Candidatus Methylomirabilia bacterium]
MPDRESLIQWLTAENEEFRKLREEHQGYEQELAELRARPFGSDDQQWRMSELKKRKLMAKDRMEGMIRQAAQTSSPGARA